MTDRYHQVDPESPRRSTSSRSDRIATAMSSPVGSPPPSPVPEEDEEDEGDHNGTYFHTRPSSRVKFTAGGGESPSDSETEDMPGPLPQPPPAAHSPSAAPLSTGVRDPPPLDLHTSNSTYDDSVSPFPALADEEGYDLSRNTSGQKGKALNSAYQRAQRLASWVRRPSYLAGRGKSDQDDDNNPLEQIQLPPPAPPGSPTSRNENLEMEDMAEKGEKHNASSPSAAAGHAGRRSSPPPPQPPLRKASQTHEANRIVRQMTRRDAEGRAPMGQTGDASGPPPRPPSAYGDYDIPDYIERPSEYRMGVLANLLKLYSAEERSLQQQQQQQRQQPQQPRQQQHSPQVQSPQVQSPQAQSPPGSVTPERLAPTRPKQKWYDKSPNQSSTSLMNLLPKSPKHSPKRSRSSSHGRGGGSSGGNGGGAGAEPELKRSRSSGMLAKAADKFRSKPHLEEEIKVTVHIAAILSRQRYLNKLCEALMRYGAPTHRLEEYLAMTARVLEIDAQFLYLPGCMFVSFGDATTHTTDLRLLRHPQGVDLGKLAEIHEIYKEVVHDLVGVEEATSRIEAVMARKQRYNVWWLILLYGCASATVGPFAFSARPIDMPIAFILGAILGALNYLLAPRSILYANIFELTAALATSFLARAFGSIPYGDDKLFCFPALAQSAIALILPGYIVLCSSLELQSRNILAGSVRLVFAIIYSLVLGFGIMLGTSFYGSMDKNASAAYTCPQDPHLNDYTQRFPFVILFTLCLVLINQAKWKQAPMMIVTSFAGYVVSYFSSRHFSSNTQIANALGAFVIGVLGNLYSRLSHGLAAAAMLPAIFVQVPSGLAATGSLISGLTYANEMTRNGGDNPSTTTTAAGSAPTSTGGPTDQMNSSKVYGNVVFDMGYGMVQVSLAITVGLFLAALVVYPLGKRRSALFSF